MDIDLVNKIKRLVIIALASDDELIESIVLKGGNAIDLAYQTSDTVSRTSFDLDFSIEDGDFKQDLEIISSRIQKTLLQTFAEHEYVIFDFKFQNQPKSKSGNSPNADFWGGYKATFKVSDRKTFDANKTSLENQRRLSIPLNPNHSTTFELEFSKFEYVGKKAEIKVDGFTIYIYTPEMIVFEKLRAICQQLPQYGSIVKSHSPRARARDFYDIHLIMNLFDIDANSEENKNLIANIFAAKRVPLSFIKDIGNHKALHKDNWESVKDTVSITEELKEFDFYFKYVLNTFQEITFP